jgi:hypothetical protein
MRLVWNFDDIIWVAAIDVQALSVRGICEALRWCDILIYGLSALALVVSCPPSIAKVPERCPREFVLTHQPQAATATSAFSSQQRARTSSEARHVETKYRHRAHRILHHHSLYARHFTSPNTIIPSGSVGPLTWFVLSHRHAEQRPSGLRQGVLRKPKALPAGVNIHNGGQLRQ